MTGASRDRFQWLLLAHGYGLAVAAVLGFFVLRIPVQLTDSFTSIMSISRPWGELMRDQFLQAGYLRPGLWAEMKLVHDLAGGEFYWFRITQVVQVTVLIGLFVHILRPRRLRDALVVPLALAVLVGNHTFAWTVREAYPVNTFLTILLCCAAAVALSSAQPRWWTTPAALLLLIVSALTVETGLLVWVILAGGYVVGWRGVSGRGIAGASALVAGYFALRFLVLANGLPGLTERESGFGFERHSTDDLIAMFGDNILPFYAYNVVVSVMTVLVGEPRNGVFDLTRDLARGQWSPPLVVGLVASVSATIAVGHYAWTRRRQVLQGDLSHGDRLVLMFVFVLAANAAISFGYTKDVIMSPAGLLQAAAVYVAVGNLIERRPTGALARAGVAALLLVVSSSWAVRSVGLHAAMDRMAGVVREQWAFVDEWLGDQGSTELSSSTATLKQRLQDDANIRYPARPQIRDEWTRLFEVD